MVDEFDKDLVGLELEKGQIDLSEAIRHIIAGKCVFTFVNTVKDTHLTYLCKAAKFRNKKVNRNLFFLSALCGPDNTKDYKYFGLIRIIDGIPEYEYAEKATISRDAKTVTTFEYIWQHLMLGKTFNTLEMYHSTHCCRCGRVLTVDKSVKSGFGPVCANLYINGK